MNWRVLMKADSTLEKYPQNPQNPNLQEYSEDIENVFCRIKPPVSPPNPLIGHWIEFKSPVLGFCTGKVVMEEGDEWLMDHHSVTKTLTPIKKTWLLKVLDHPIRGQE